MTTARCARCSHASSGQSLRALLAVCGLSVLLGTSCSVRKTSQTYASSSDTLRERIEVQPVPVTLPGETTTLQLPIQTLPMLPDGAGYSVRQGRIHLKATRQGDSLHLVASTDSATLYPRVEHLYLRQHKTLRSVEQKEVDQRTGSYISPLFYIIPIIIPIILIIIALWLKIKRRLPQRR